MLTLAKMDNEKKVFLFKQTSVKLGLRESIIEKDFWVSYILDFLFNRSIYKNDFIFKGGTSLSKVYNIINRFSEDIDLVLNLNLIEVNEEDLFAEKSFTRKEKDNDLVRDKSRKFLKEVLLKYLNEEISKELSLENLFSIESDEDTILFHYPRLHENEYVVNDIRLEIGPLSANTPNSNLPIDTYVFDVVPQLKNEDIYVNAISYKRTFLDKLTILHSECNRTTNNTPIRYSRHFYDMYMILCYVDNYFSLMDDLDLIKDIIKYKTTFYRKPSAKYEDILKGELQLIPNNEKLKFFENDYKQMSQMLFGDIPDFSDIVKSLKEFELAFNIHIKKCFQ